MIRSKRTISFEVQVVVESDDTGFHAYAPAFKGLHTCGQTEDEALQNVANAIEAYLQSLIKHGDPIPVGVVMRLEEAPPFSATAPQRYENLRVPCPI